MPRPKFTKEFRLYGDWLKAHPIKTKYVKSVIEKHKTFPDKNLKALLGIKSSKETLNKLPVKSLSEADLQDRNNSLNIIARMRNKGYSLKKAIEFQNSFDRQHKVTEKTVKKHVGKTLYKDNKKWKVRKTDQIQARIHIYSKGEDATITVKNSKDRETIGQYFKDVHKMLKGEMEEKDFDKKWRRKHLKDINGEKWSFETRREVIEDLRGANVADKFRSIYDTKTTV